MRSSAACASWCSASTSRRSAGWSGTGAARSARPATPAPTTAAISSPTCASTTARSPGTPWKMPPYATSRRSRDTETGDRPGRAVGDAQVGPAVVRRQPNLVASRAVHGGGHVLHRGDRRRGRRCGHVSLRNPFYAVLALVCHLLALAALFLLLRAEFVAAAQVVVYAGAVMVLYVFVVAYVGGSDEPLTASTGASLRFASILFALALFVELTIALDRHLAVGARQRRRAVRGGLRHARRGRRAVPHALPGGVRARLAAAADRGRRRRDPGPAPLGPARGRRGLGGRRDAPARGDARRRRAPGTMIEAAAPPRR